MKFIIGYAGIPSRIYDDIAVKGRKNICGSNCEFMSFSLRSKNGVMKYTQSDAEKFVGEFASRLKGDHENKLADTGFALIYIVHEADADTTRRFVESFFPAILTIPVNWQLDETSDKTIKSSTQALADQLRLATDRVREIIPTIKKEVTEADSRTPLLLPIKNFKSKRLTPCLLKLQAELVNANDVNSLIKKAINSFVHDHPRQKSAFPRYQRDCFVDERKIEFNPPGKDRHGFPRAGNGHTDRCYLAGHRRFGAPYDHAFHYDCVRGKGNLSDEFYGCHSEPKRMEGNPHLNISPNDFVRI